MLIPRTTGNEKNRRIITGAINAIKRTLRRDKHSTRDNKRRSEEEHKNNRNDSKSIGNDRQRTIESSIRDWNRKNNTRNDDDIESTRKIQHGGQRHTNKRTAQSNNKRSSKENGESKENTGNRTRTGRYVDKKYRGIYKVKCYKCQRYIENKESNLWMGRYRCKNKEECLDTITKNIKEIQTQ